MNEQCQKFNFFFKNKGIQIATSDLGRTKPQDMYRWKEEETLIKIQLEISGIGSELQKIGLANFLAEIATRVENCGLKEIITFDWR